MRHHWVSDASHRQRSLWTGWWANPECSCSGQAQTWRILKNATEFQSAKEKDTKHEANSDRFSSLKKKKSIGNRQGMSTCMWRRRTGIGQRKPSGIYLLGLRHRIGGELRATLPKWPWTLQISLDYGQDRAQSLAEWGGVGMMANIWRPHRPSCK